MGTWINIKDFKYKCSVCQHEMKTIFVPPTMSKAWKTCPWCGDKKEESDEETGEV